MHSKTTKQQPFWSKGPVFEVYRHSPVEQRDRASESLIRQHGGNEVCQASRKSVAWKTPQLIPLSILQRNCSSLS